jgi:hypothetical protein
MHEADRRVCTHPCQRAQLRIALHLGPSNRFGYHPDVCYVPLC